MDDLTNSALDHIAKLLWNYSAPPLEGDLAKIPKLKEIHNELEKFRKNLSIFSTDRNENLLILVERLCRQIETHDSAIKALQKSESRYKNLASHDYLTGSMNRRYFLEEAIAELDYAFRLGLSCGIIMIDIDYFKDFNDTYGHVAGDEALKHIVKVISSFSRKHDFLGRYGGEEFVFFFSNAGADNALVVGERIREAIQNNPVKIEAGSVAITASLGIAMADFIGLRSGSVKEEDYIMTLIDNADTAMYKAKKAGRNQVKLFSDES